MLLLGNILSGLGSLLSSVIFLCYIVLIIRAVASWFSPDPRNPIMQILVAITEPMLYPVRKRIRPFGMIDLSIIVVLLGLFLIDNIVARSLVDYGTVIRSQSLSTAVGF